MRHNANCVAYAQIGLKTRDVSTGKGFGGSIGLLGNNSDYSAKNGQGLPSGGRGRLKKLVRERGRRVRKVKMATLNVGGMTGRSGEIAS